MAENGGAYDGSINIRTRLDNSEIGSDITALRSKLDGLSQRLGNMFKGGIKTSGLAQQLVSIRQKIEAITADNTGEKLRAQFETAQSQAAYFEQRLQSMVKRLDEMKARITQQQGTFTPTAEYKQLKGDIASVGRAYETAQSQAAQAEARITSYEERRRKKLDELTNAYERLNMKAQTAANTERASTAAVSRNVDKAIGKSNKTITDTAKAANNATKSTRNFGEMLARTAKRILIFRLVHTVFQAIATRFSALIEKNEELKTSLRTLKGSFSMAFQPLLDAVVPVLTKIFSIAAKVFKVITAIIAALFGKTAAQAAASSAALDEEAGAISGVGSAAKKASKSLANFDEINQLTADTAGGAGGGLGGGLGAIYDTEGLENVYAWLEKIKQSKAFQYLKEAWDRLKKKWDEFTSNPAVQRAFELIGRVLTDKIIPALLDTAWSSFETALNVIADVLTVIAAILSGDLREGINGIKDLITDLTFGPLLTGIGFLDDLFGTDAQSKVRKLYDTIKSFDLGKWLSDKWQKAKPILKAIGAFALSIIGNIWEGFKTKIVDPLTNWLEKPGGVVDKVRQAWENIKYVSTLASMWFYTNVYLPISEWAKKLINFVIRIVNKMIDGLNKIHVNVKIPDWVADLMGISHGGALSLGFSIPKIPELARGAVIPPNAPFLAMLGDQKRGTNIEAPLDTLVEAFKAAQSNTPVTIRFEGSLAQLGQLLKPVIDSENKRKGGTFAVIGG